LAPGNKPSPFLGHSAGFWARRRLRTPVWDFARKGLSAGPALLRPLGGPRPAAIGQLELFRAAPPLDTVYVPIGCGSGICGLIAARDALGLETRIVGVVASTADAYAQSFRARRPIETATAVTIADGMAVRVPVPAALDAILAGAADVMTVTDAEVEAAMRAYFDDTHQVAEGAGAAPLAALLKDTARKGSRRGVILCGGNVDRDTYARIVGQAAG